MLFKIWTPRFMLAAAVQVGVDLAILLGVALWGVVAGKVAETLGSEME